MVAPIRFLSGRQQQQKIGVEGSTEEQKVLEVIGRVGIGTTIFDADYNLDVRGTANISGILSVGQIISGAGNSFSDLYVSGLSTFKSDVYIDASVDIQNDLNVGGITTTGTLYVGAAGTIGITTILDEDDMVSDSDTALATQQSIKAYVDNLVDSQDLDFAGDTGIGAVDLDDQVFTIQGTTNEIETVGSGTTLTIGLPDDVTITSSLTVGSEFKTISGIGVSIINGVSETATIYGPSNLIIDPMPVGVGTTSGIVRIKGDLYVDGTEFIVNSSTIELADFVVGIATTVPNDILLDGAGIGIGTDKTFLYEYNGGTNPSLKSSENLNVAAGKHYQIGETEVLSSTTLGAGVTLSSLTTVGVITGGTWQATAINDDYIGTIDNADKVSLSALNIDGGPDIAAPISDGDLFIVDDGGAGNNRSADVIGLTTYTFGKVSGDITISSTGTATIQANSVGLGTDTFGQYASTITGGAGLTATAPNADDATAYTIDVGAGTGITVNADDVAIKNADNLTNNKVVKWDDGNGQLTDSIITDSGTSVGINSTAPTSTLDVNGTLNVTGVATFQSNVYLGDNDKINLGDNDDLQFYHDGTDSWIWEQGPGNLYLRSNGGSINLRLNSTDMVVVNENSSVDLYYGSSKKFETTGYGVTVSGGAYVSGISTFASDIYVGASLYDNNNVNGNTNEVLVSTGSGVVWTTLNTGGVAGGLQIEDANVGTYYITASDKTSGVSTAGFINSQFVLDQNGNVGIGSTQPTAKLDVNGDVNIAGVATINQLGVNQISPDGIDYGNANQVPVADGSGGWEWLPVTNAGAGILDAIVVLDEGALVGSSGTATTLDFKGNNIIAIGTAGSNIATITVSDTPTFDSLTISGVSTFTGAIDANGNLDVDGHTELDDLNVSGVSTFTGAADFNGNVDVDGHTELDDLNVSGVSTFTGAADFNGNVDVDGHTELDNLKVVGVATFTGGGAKFENGIDTFDVRYITQTNTKISFGSDIISLHGNVGINSTAPTSKLDVVGDAKISGVSTFTGAIDANGNLDVDGHTELDDLNVSGVSTFTGAADFNGNVDIDGHTELDDVNVSGAITATTFSGDLSGNAGTATALETARTFEITGDVVASAISFDGTGNVSLAATIQPNSVGLGTDTVGDYVESISGTANQITVTGGSGEGSTPTLSIPNQFTIPQDATVTRDLNVLRDLSVTGNITVGGTSATLFTSTLKVEDPDIILGIRTDAFGNDISTDTTANHGGIAIASTEGNPLVDLTVVGIETVPTTYKKIMWFKAGTFAGLGTDAWLSNYAVGIGSTQFPTGTRLAAGNVQITEDDISVVRNINASGIATLPTIDATNATIDSLTFTSGTAITGVDTDLTAVSTSDDTLASAKAIKAYVDAQNTGQDLDIQGDTGGLLSIDLDDETLTIAGTANEIETVGSGNTITIGLPNDVTISNLTVSNNLNVSGVSTFQNDANFDNGLLYVDSVNNRIGIGTNAPSTAGVYVADIRGPILIGASPNQLSIESGEIRTNGLHLNLYGGGISGSEVNIRNNSNIRLKPQTGGVELYYGKTDKKFETTGYGVTVSGGAYVSGISTFQNNIEVTGNISVNDTTVVGSATASLSTLTETAIHTGLSASTYRSVEYTIQATQGTNFHATKILALHNGTTAYHNEYGTIYNNTSVATFNVDVSGGNIRLLATGASASQTDYVVNFTATKI